VERPRIEALDALVVEVERGLAVGDRDPVKRGLRRPAGAADAEGERPAGAREARASEGSRRERALDAYSRARELAVVAPRVSLDPAATVFQIGGILASVADPPLP